MSKHLLKSWINHSAAIVLAVISFGLHHSEVTASPRTDQLVLSNRLIKFLCIVDRRIVKLPKGWDAPKKCAPPTAKVQPCYDGSRVICTKLKGSQTSGPILIRPYGRTLMDHSPLLVWSAVNGATSYSVEVKGKGVQWQSTAQETTLTYPSDQPVLQAGQAYQITIIAIQGETPVKAEQFAVNLLPQDDVREIEALVKQVRNLPISQDQATYLIDILFTNDGLLTESIATLEAQVKAGSQNPLIYRTLGDRYLQAGISGLAKKMYETADRLAKASGNKAEQARAQAGLELIATYSQPPTRMKHAQ